MKNNRKQIWSWALYDWGNSAFATTVMAGFFPVFFKQYWSAQADVTESTFYLGLANSTAAIIVAAFAPFLGAVADQGSAKKRFLALFAFLGVVMTGSLWMVAQGQWQLAVLFYIGGTIGFSGGNIFYDSLLPSIATEDKFDYVSSLGFALGYIGGGLLFLVNVLMFQMPHVFGIPDQVTAVKLSFLTVAVWWGVFSIPVMLFVPEPVNEKKRSIIASFSSGWGQLVDTFRKIRDLKIVGIFLLAYWLYIDGVDTIIRMAVDYGMALGFGAGSLITALLMVQFVAFPAALAYSWIAGRIGVKKAIFTAIIGYCCITIGGYFMQKEMHFYILAFCIALFQGGIQALSRSMYSRIIPEKYAAQFFGFYNMLGKFAAVVGPIMVGTIAQATGNPRIGIASILILFFAGGYLLLKVNLAEGEKLAREYVEK